MQIQLTHMKICPRERFALSRWLFVVRRLAASCVTLRQVATNTWRAAPCGTASGVNEPWFCADSLRI